MFKFFPSSIFKTLVLLMMISIVPLTSFAGPVDGGNLAIVGGQTQIDICAGDDISDSFNVTITDTIGAFSAWAITDTFGIVLAVPTGPPFDLDGAGPGVCLIWHIAHDGTLSGLNVNADVSNLVGCFDLSNEITVNRSAVDGGNISFTGGETLIEICAGDGVPDPVDVVFTNSALGEFFTWVVSDPSGEILTLQSNPTFDFEADGQGVSLIRGLSYNGPISNLAVGNNIDSLAGCFAYTNPISVKRNAVNGGLLTTTTGATQLAICASDGQSDAFNVSLTQNTGDAGDWIVTDANGIIQEIPATPPFDFEGTGTGTCQIWFLAYTDTVMNMVVGNNVSQITGCYDFSNPITVNRDGADAGVISFLDGSSVANVCTGDGNADLVDVNVNAFLGGINRWLITDTNNVILDLPMMPPFDFEAAGAGTCLIYRISHCAGVGGIQVGNNLTDITGLFDISNSISVIRTAVSPGTIEIMGGGTEISICAGDGISDAFNVTLMGNSASNEAWVITDGNGEILGLPAGPPFDLDGAGPGTCYIWHLGYEMGLTGLTVGDNVDSLAGCFVFSNDIEVIRDEPSAGQIQFTAGGSQASICSGDEISDPLDVDLTGFVGGSSAWVITTPDSTILDLPTGPPFELEGAGAGTCYIYHVGYGSGTTGLMVGSNLQNLNGCFEVSNGLSVVREAVAGGDLTLMDGSDQTFICTNDGNSDAFMVILNDNIGDSSAWVITDPAGTILDLPTSPPFDFEGVGAGHCILYNLSYSTGLTGLMVGSSINNLVGCYAFSSEIDVFREAPQGGNLTFAGGGTSISICATDGVPDPLTPSISGNIGGSTSWIVTDTTGIILDLPSGPTLDFEGAGSGECLIWHLSYGVSLSGLTVGADVNNLVGCFALSNSISVLRNGGDGGSLTTTNGDTEIEICANDGVSDAFNILLSGNSGDSSAWVITDTAGEILGLPLSPPFDLEGAGQGICLIYNLEFDTGLTGLTIGQSTSNLTGCYSFSNPITVIRTAPEGGQLMLPGGGDTTTICAGDGSADPITPILMNNQGTATGWIITDPNGFILDLPAGPTFDLEGAGAGQCLIYHISYGGTLGGLAVNLNVANITGCYALSNAIVINRNAVDGGLLSATNGSTFMSICANDGVSDQFNVNLSSVSGDSSAWLITDPSGNILGLPVSPPFDLEGAGQGTCSIWHLSYNASMTGLAIGNNTSMLSGCFDLSNPITVERNAPNGGQLMLPGGGTAIDICAGDGVADNISPIQQNVSGANSNWVITDTMGNILDLPTSLPIDFDGAGTGVCLIWNITYGTGLTGLVAGNNTSNLSGCFSLSNSITVSRESVNGGTLQTTDGLTEIGICAGDGVSDAFNVTQTDTVGPIMSWVITDTLGNILGLPAAPPFDLEGAGTGVCLVWNLAHTINLTGLTVGNNTSMLTGCFSLSNPIEVTRSSAATASVIEIMGGGTTIDICAGDGVSDAFNVTLTPGTGTNLSWIITDPNLNILDLPTGPPFDLEGAGDGQCLIWAIDYVANVPGLQVGGNVGNFTGCFALSNSITVNRSGVAGGSITTTTGQTVIDICVGDGVSDAFNVNLTGNAGDTQGWIITDTTGNILGLPAAPPFDLDGAGTGVCQIWHIAYNDSIVGLAMGQNVSGLMGCYSLSNAIQVNRTENVGGEAIITGSGFEIDICTGDGVSDAFDVTLTGNTGQNSGWVITNQNGEILGLPAGPPFDLEGAGGGVCLIRHISYTDGLIGLSVGENANLLQGCHAFSNVLRVNRDAVAAGNLTLTDLSDSLTICAGDGVADPFDVILTGAVGTNSSWVITNETGEILGLPAGPPFDLEGAGAGVCLVWNIAHGDDLTGLTVGASTAGLQGCYLLSNPITVTRVTEGSLCMTGIEDLTDHGSFMITPNPTSGQINVNINRPFNGLVSIRVLDLSGRILVVKESNQSLINLDIDSFSAGVYFIEISNAEFNGTQKVIKQ